ARDYASGDGPAEEPAGRERVGPGDADTAAERRVVGEEAERLRVVESPQGVEQIKAAEHLDVRPAAGACTGDDVWDHVNRVNTGRGDENAAGEPRVVGHELLDDGEGDAVEDADVRAAAGAGRGDDVRHAVAGDVSGGDPHPAAERRRVGEKAGVQTAVGVVHVDNRQAAG